MNTTVNNIENVQVDNINAVENKPTYASIVIEDVKKDESRVVNAHRKEWYDIYTKIRALCILKGEKIRKYAPQFAGNPRKSISFTRGKLNINQEFWASLKPAHKSQLRMITNQIQSLYSSLELAQA